MLRASAQALAAALATGALAGAAQAQGTPQRVEITGSAIKRIDGETALPVQVITRDEFTKQGATTAAEIISRLAATASNLTDGGSVAYGGFRDQMGFNGANLRGLGVSSTLVLLNGRRMANFASPGDAAGVDLNSIPAAAIERVEVLLDGASALYGSDAIGGVINFITRKDFTGIELAASALKTTEGGGGDKRSATLSGGYGDLARDRFNVIAVLDLQKTTKLNAMNRKFIKDLQIPERLPDLLSSYTFPGNIRLSSSQLDTLVGEGFSTNGKTVIDSRTINPAAATGCNPPANLYLPEGIGGIDGCTFDYMRDIELYPESTKSSLFTRAMVDLGGGHNAFVELSLARARTLYSGTPNRYAPDIDVSLVPALAGSALNSLDADHEDRLITVRTRLSEAGLRTSELVSTGQRLVLGTTGLLGTWDYEWALNHGISKVSDRDHQGYLNEQMLIDGFADGTLNPFGPSGAAGRALYEAAQIRGEVRSAKGTMSSLDLKVSRPLMKLAGGDLALALGGELRRERQDYHQSQALAAGLILGESSQGPDADFGKSRRVSAVFGEISAPLSKQLELQGAMRYEHYQTSGGKLSPKLGLKYAPIRELLLRASAGAGFRAPSMSDLYRPVTEGASATLVDPVCMAADPENTPTDCSEIWTTVNYSNAKLKPETSRQLALGLVFEPARDMSLSLDYWAIEKRNLISTLGVDVILANLDKYGSLVHRDEDNEIDHIDLVKENRGAQKISGLDIGLAISKIASPVGQFGARLNGTLTLRSKQQTGNGDPFVSNLGRFLNDGVVQRWRHTISLDWQRGPVNATLSNSFLSGYGDQLIVGKADRRVSSYSLWNLSAGWEPMKALSLRATVQNLFDTAPPFSQQAWFFLSGYDPSYTDTRGRSVSLSMNYAFR
ncbi:TonB-dependent receptor [Aquabacterium sp. OR-4]|uniref:TonB-dependent receptor n=1 Tax=Aquabacterium sp. OR-4 TaxID=2978127 RepID=UPI0021B2D93D|nr:TonB-dependent receptor [Aquabacterium sp. OR-4]MDT7833716.1 TonB-dependent receptor [Aquabacterium sp. OR-4]